MIDITNNCPHCGKQLTRPDASFCTNCGAPLKGEAGQTITTVHGGSLAKIIVHLPGKETQEEFLSKAVTTLGRRRSNMIQVLSPIVSGEHAKIELTRKGHAITDLNSTNGTYVNGRRLEPGRPHLLASNDIIRFSDGMGNSASLTYVAPSLFTEVEAVDVTQVFELATDVSYIGRNSEAAITLDHPAVSWNHAKVIKRDENRYTIQDLSSNNGTFLNGRQLRQERGLERGDVIQIGPFNLVYRDRGIFAPFSAERNFRLEAVDLEKTFYATNIFGVKNKSKFTTVLHNLDLVINPREFVALVGGSGTGKSTLMKALSGVSPATSGTVLVNGDNLYQNFNLYRNMMGYVPQDDIIHQGLTVHRALYYAARLRLPDASRSEIEARINDVLAKVGLTAQAKTLVRHLSGGQRKRVSIAAELLAEPWIFFLDEPTSGLDPGLEKLMMDTLRQLADEGRTIVLVTHATVNITNNCDQVAFMARGGELTYFGPPEEAIDFFQVNDFSDIYTRLSQTFTFDHDPTVPAEIKPEYDDYLQTHQPSPENSETPQIPAGPFWAARYRKSAAHQTYIANRQTGEVARPITTTAGAADASLTEQIKQFGVLTRRYLDLIRHDKLSLWVLLAVMPIIGLFLLLISDGAALVGHTTGEITAILEAKGSYSIVNQAQTLLFMMALSANLLGIFAAAFEIIKEEPIYRRERMINLGIFPYFASKFIVLGAFMVLQCLLLLIVLALKIDFPSGGAILWSPLEYYLTLVLTALASVALGLFISALVSSRNTVIYLILIALFVQIVFSGAIFELSPLTQPLSHATITRWALEGLGASTDMDTLNDLGQVRVEREVDIGRGVQKVVEDVPATMNFYVNYTHNALALISRWIFLVVQTLVWSSLAIWLIKRKDEI
jgi:ABC-type multidrug transport system ATPase subunit/pSer/pThr/pTyr-binding forkhead associated (FHA) protein